MTTYTYTARSVENPDKVLTFTLQGDFLKVNLTGLEENITEILTGDEDLESVKKGLSSQVGPTALKVMEGISGPVHVSDAKAELHGSEENYLRITLWKRLAGLRAAPIVLDMEEVDNPEAASRFLDELRARRQAAGKISKFIGPLDYWLGWIGISLLALFLIRRTEDE